MKHIGKIIFSLVFLHALLVTFPVQAEEGHVDESVTDYLKKSDQQNNQEDAKEDNGVAIGTSSNELSAWDFIKMIFTTLFVIALIYLLLRLVNKKNRLFSQDKFIENLGGTSLGTNKSIQLVKIGDRILVVGVGESIRLLKEIDDSDEIKDILEHYNASLESMIQPKDLINRFIEKKREIKRTEKDPFSSILQKQLSELTQGRKKIVEQFEDKESKKE